jgi:hypothetical protein
MTDFDERDTLPAQARPVVRTQIKGVPVYSFGYTDFYSESPDLTDEKQIQLGNANTAKKIHPKKSWDIHCNHLGATAPRMPRTPANDYQPLECINLIDGNDETCWCSRFHTLADETPLAWVRIDLASEREINRIVLKKRPITFDRWKKPGSKRLAPGAVEVGRAMPGRLTIKASIDAYHWDILFEGDTGDTPDREIFTYTFSTGRYKQVWILGDELPKCEDFFRTFSIASVEIYDPTGRNIALASYGNGVTASSTFHGHGCERETHHWLWPIHMDCGLKWTRIGYHDDPINWHWVEKEKGVLAFDEEADQAVTLLAKNGVEVVYCINFGNRLYQKDPTRYFPQMWEWYFENPEPPKTEEALAAWANFVRFSVNHFKDRVRYFEVWNEWNGDLYWGDTPDVNHYIKIARITIDIIRREAPEAKIVLGSYAGFSHGIADWTEKEFAEKKAGDPLLIAIKALAKEVDVIGYHPFYQMDVAGPVFRRYTANVMAFKAYCEECGFKGGQYMASEYNFGANYPIPEEKNWWGNIHYTEIQKAKIVAQVSVIHTALGVDSFFCETWSNVYPLDLSLLRRTFEGYPITPLQPQAAYYVTRNLATALDELKPASFPVTVEEKPDLEIRTMEKPGVQIVAAWFAGLPREEHPGLPLTFTVQGPAKNVSAYNCMTGEETEISFKNEGDTVIIKDIIIRDFPILIRLSLSQN